MRIRWRHVDGFDDDVDYLEWDGSQMWQVLKDGTRETADKSYTLKQCRRYVALGLWVEWSVP